jgi:CRISPR-associated protein Cas6
MVDLAFALRGTVLPRDYRRPLAAALEHALPWLAQAPGAGVHRLNLTPGAGGQALLAQRTRLLLRVPRERADAAALLAGRTLDLAGHALHVGPPQTRELLPWGTLYAHLVASAADDEAAFMAEVDAALQALQVPCRPICGRHQSLEQHSLQGYSLMLDGLSAADSLQLLQCGIGHHRRLGCGLFVPHRSAAAVGTPH